MKNNHIKVSVFLLCFFPMIHIHAQHTKPSLKDSLDGALDLSDYIIQAHGFVPVPIIVTEPSLGGFGGGIVPIFLKKRPPFVDSVKGEKKITPVAPDITGAAGMYTLNDSWMVGAFRSGTFIKSHIKYIIGGGYGNINMSYYKTLPQLGEKEFKFNIQRPTVFLQATKKIGYSNWYAGLKYTFIKADIKYVGDKILPVNDWVKPIEYSSIVSQLGAVVEFDNRDNVFTPNNGLKFHIDGICSDNIFGSDYDFWRSNYYMYAYKTLSKKLVGGLRIDGQQTFNNPPFFLYPFVDMRGIPANRYSGKADILSEVEFRWDCYKRWSAMLYGGAGKAFNEWSEFGPAEWAYSYGTGFRYLLARKFKLRVGVDVARGPEKFAYYIVFGSNWLK